MCSNNESNFIPLDNEDIRFFILKIPQFEKEDPDFLDKLVDEIPAFFHFLGQRKVVHPKISRAWFKKEYLITDQFKKIRDNTKSQIHNDIESYILEVFNTYELNEFMIDAKRLMEKVNEGAKYKHSKSSIISFLKNEKELSPHSGAKRFKIPVAFEERPYRKDGEKDYAITYEDIIGAPYTFTRKDWIKNNDGVKELQQN
jgi:hypothetical protein